jgi:phage gp16-like protein
MKSTSQSRNSQLAQIHIARAQLDMAEDVYRELLMKLGRVTTAADLDDAGRRVLLNHFKKLGFVPAGPKSELAKTKQGRYLLVLWKELFLAGRVQDRREAALLAYIKNHAKVDHIKWLTDDHYSEMVRQLKQWAGRK